MRPDDIIRIRHMIEAGESAQGFLAGRVRADLDKDRMLLFALVRAIEIIGEAAGRVSAEARSEMKAIPWPAIVAMRNRLIHAYFDIDSDVVWRTVTEEIPPLLAELKRVIPED